MEKQMLHGEGIVYSTRKYSMFISIFNWRISFVPVGKIKPTKMSTNV